MITKGKIKRTTRLASVLLAVALLLPASSASAFFLSACTGYVTHHYDQNGNIVNTIISCSGTCSGSASCEDITAGDFTWCHCTTGGGTGPCVTVMVDRPNTLEEGVGCANIGCGVRCEIVEIEYANPETGHEFVESHCECP